MIAASTIRIAMVALAVIAALLPPSTGRTIDASTGRLLVVDFWAPPHHAGARAQILAVDRSHVSVLAQDRNVLWGITSAPDAKHIAFIDYVFARAEVWVMGRDGANRHRLVVLPHSPCGNAIGIDTVVWAPGGHRLAYTASINSDFVNFCPAARHEVTGTWVTPLLHPAPRKVSDLSDGFGGLSWSPRAQTLLVIPGFVNGPHLPDMLSNTGGLVALNVQTGSPKMLVRAQSSRLEFRGQFAPITGTLGFSLGPFGAPGRSVISAAGAQGKHRHQLATVPGAVTSISWSPDGRSLVVITDSATLQHAGVRSLWVIGAGSHRLRRLAVNAQGPILSPAWSPDGRQVAYIGGRYACFGHSQSYSCVGSRTNGTAVYSVDVATGQQRVVLAGDRGNGSIPRPATFTALAWSR